MHALNLLCAQGKPATQSATSIALNGYPWFAVDGRPETYDPALSTLAVRPAERLAACTAVLLQLQSRLVALSLRG